MSAAVMKSASSAASGLTLDTSAPKGLERKGSKVLTSPIKRTKSSVSNTHYRIANYPIKLILEDISAFASFVNFSKKFHNSENVFFWCAAIAFRQSGRSNSTLKRSPSMVLQEQLDLKESQWRGATVQHIQILREALTLYDRFIAPDSKDEVCLPVDCVSAIEKQIEAARTAKKGKMPLLDYNLFHNAEKLSLYGMVHDILPRYLKHLAKENDVTMMDYLRELQKLKPVRSKLDLSAQEQSEMLVSDDTIRNALSCLYPTPREVLLNKPGSCLMAPIVNNPLLQSNPNPAGSAVPKLAETRHSRGFSLRGLFSSAQKKEAEASKGNLRYSTGSKGSNYSEAVAPRIRSRSKSQ